MVLKKLTCPWDISVFHKVISWNTCGTPIKCHYCPDKFTFFISLNTY